MISRIGCGRVIARRALAQLAWIAVLVVATVGPVVASAQQNDAIQNGIGYKDPGTATIIGVLVAGGGQMYSGETKKGLTIFGVGLGSLLVGTVLTASSCDLNCSTAPFWLGWLGYLAAWGYGVADAADAARRHNATLRIKGALQPTIRPFDGGSVGVGLTLGF